MRPSARHVGPVQQLGLLLALALPLALATAGCATTDDGFAPIEESPPDGTAGKAEPGTPSTQGPAPKTPTGAVLTFVGDTRTMVFYPADAPAAAKVPAANRVEMDDPYDALNRGFYPDADSDPMGRWK